MNAAKSHMQNTTGTMRRAKVRLAVPEMHEWGRWHIDPSICEVLTTAFALCHDLLNQHLKVPAWNVCLRAEALHKEQSV
jgi:hypothetical protein